MIEALFEGAVHQGLIKNGASHFLSPMEIDLDGDTAVARGYSVVFVWSDGAFKAHRIASSRWNLKRIDGAWRITLRGNRLLDGAEEARAVLK